MLDFADLGPEQSKLCLTLCRPFSFSLFYNLSAPAGSDYFPYMLGLDVLLSESAVLSPVPVEVRSVEMGGITTCTTAVLTTAALSLSNNDARQHLG